MMNVKEGNVCGNATILILAWTSLECSWYSAVSREFWKWNVQFRKQHLLGKKCQTGWCCGRANGTWLASISVAGGKCLGCSGTLCAEIHAAKIKNRKKGLHLNNYFYCIWCLRMAACALCYDIPQPRRRMGVSEGVEKNWIPVFYGKLARWCEPCRVDTTGVILISVHSLGWMAVEIIM